MRSSQVAKHTVCLLLLAIHYQEFVERCFSGCHICIGKHGQVSINFYASVAQTSWKICRKFHNVN